MHAWLSRSSELELATFVVWGVEKPWTCQKFDL
jgi:hypothetical protein